MCILKPIFFLQSPKYDLHTSLSVFLLSIKPARIFDDWQLNPVSIANLMQSFFGNPPFPTGYWKYPTNQCTKPTNHLIKINIVKIKFNHIRF